MAETIIAGRLTLDGKDANQTVKSFKQELREANTDLINIQNQFGATSKEALNAAKRVAEMKDRMQEAREVSDLFDPGAKFQVFGNVLRTVTGGFTALTGTMALFGSESADVEKALLKVQSALAITEGVNTIVDSAKDFDRLKAVIMSTSVVQKTLATSTALTSGAFKLFGVSVTTTSFSFKALRGAIIATGIGALVVGVGLLIANFDKVKKAVLNLIPGLGKVAEFIGDLIEKVTDFAGVTSQAERNYAKLEKSVSATNAEFDRQIKLLEAQGGQEAKIAELQKKKLSNEEQLLNNKKKLTELTVEEIKQLKDAETEKQAIDLAENKRLDDLAKKQEEKRKEDSKKAKEERDRKREELKKKLEDEKAYQAEIQKGYEDTTAMLYALDEEKKQKDNEAFLSRTNNLRNNLQAQIDVMRELQVMQMDDVSMQQTDELSSLNEWFISRFEIIKGSKEAETALTEEYERQKTIIEQNAANQRLNIVANVLGQAADLVGKQTVAGKSLAIASATMNTWVGATEVLRAPSVLPEPFGTIQKIVSMGTIIGSGLKSINEIVKTKVPGGGGGGAPSMPNLSLEAQAPLKPSAPIVNTSTQLPQEQINQMGNATVRAFVVEQDVTNNQERISRLNRSARLGG